MTSEHLTSEHLISEHLTSEHLTSERRIRSYKLRRGRVTASQADALARLWPTYGVGDPPPDTFPNGAAPPPADLGHLAGPSGPDLRDLADPSALFGRAAPLVLEIGFGMGEATAALAARQPGVNLLAADLHTPGVGSLLRRLEELDSGPAPRVRVVMADAVDVLAALPPQSLTLVRLFFPDPWPKARHAKRRLVSASFLDLLAARLSAEAETAATRAAFGKVALPGLHVATDWPAYAEHVREVVDGHPRFALTEPPPERERTRFERLGAEAGRPSEDLYARLLP
ncbi:MAG: tRNA (guanine(46)-N(7))-methyltransferase TrmB [Actinomycetales bacterium]